MSRLTVLAVEPYAAASHLAFLEGLRAHSRHRVELLTLPGRRWKWRMRTASLILAERIAAQRFDLLLVSDYTNLAELLALLPSSVRERPAVVYFHESQLTYPLRPGEARDHHFALTNLHALLAARTALFNSRFHLESFLGALPALLAHAPDLDGAAVVARARARSRVLPLGSDVPLAPPRGRTAVPTLVWNHRWEYDKDPELLVHALGTLAREGRPFRLRLLGQRFRRVPPAFERLREALGERLEDSDPPLDRAAYLRRLGEGHLVLSTARHEFFGLAVLEAVRLGLLPVVPADLAYPEVLGPSARFPLLWERSKGPLPALRAALDLVARDPRPTLAKVQAFSERFHWPTLAPRYDRLFEGLVAGARKEVGV